MTEQELAWARAKASVAAFGLQRGVEEARRAKVSQLDAAMARDMANDPDAGKRQMREYQQRNPYLPDCCNPSDGVAR